MVADTAREGCIGVGRPGRKLLPNSLSDRCSLVSGGGMGEKVLESVKAPRLPGFNQGKKLRSADLHRTGETMIGR